MIRRFPSLAVLIFIVVGILIADQSRAPSWMFLAGCLTCCVAGFVVLERKFFVSATWLFGAALLFFSAFHLACQFYDVGPNHVTRLDSLDRRLQVFGRVADWPDLRPDRTDFKIELDSIADPAVRRVNGSILLRVSDTTTALQRGDRVEFYGRIYPVGERVSASDSDYPRYLNLKGVFGIVYMPTLLDVRLDRRNRYAVIPLTDRLRDAVRNSLRRNLSADASALASGILIGETRDIPLQTYRRFRDSGTLHLLAVSGSNVALVVLFFVVILKPLALRPVRRAMILLLVIFVFTLLSYSEPSVVRAALMAMLVLMVGVIQRRYNLNNIIAVAACVILLFDPAQLFDIGFQLSFTIAWGLIFILPRVTALFRSVYHRRWYRWLVFPLLVSILAQVCSAGLIALHFGRVPLISPLANLAVVPLVSAAVVGCLILLAADLILPLLGAFFGSWLNLVLELILNLVNFLGDESMPSLVIAHLPVWLTVVFYLYLFLGAWSLGRKFMRRILLISLLVITNLVLFTGLLSGHASGARPQVHLMGVSGGTVAVVKRPGANHADLVMTEIPGRTYPVDERIIAPWLSRLGVIKLNSIFVLSAAYDALDDVLRLGHAYRVDRIFVEKDMGPSCLDVARVMADTSLLIRATSFYEDGNPTGTGEAYYRTSPVGLMFVAGGSRVIFADRIVPAHYRSERDTTNSILVIGSLWRTSPDDLDYLHSRGFGRIYCSKIEQRDDGEHFSDFGQPALPLPTYIYDLNRYGSVTLDL